MPIVDESDKGGGDEISDGEAIYSALSLVFSESNPDVVMAAAMAIQKGSDWTELSPPVRELFDDVADELFDDDEDGDEPDGEQGP